MSGILIEKLQARARTIPYLQFLGLSFEAAGKELTAILPFKPELIGNPMLPALHGGATAAFLEVTAIVELIWSELRQFPEPEDLPKALPKIIDLTVDYLRPGRPVDSFARARVNRSGRRYASVFIEAWQDDRNRPFAQATGHFLMPQG